MVAETRPSTPAEKKFLLLLKADAFKNKMIAERATHKSQPEVNGNDSLIKAYKLRGRLLREIREIDPSLAQAKVHIDRLNSAEQGMVGPIENHDTARNWFIKLVDREISTPDLKKSMGRVKELTELFDSGVRIVFNAEKPVVKNLKPKEPMVEVQSEPERVKLLAIEVEALNLLRNADLGYIPSKDLLNLAKKRGYKSYNAPYNLINSLIKKLKDTGITLENVFRQGYKLIDPNNELDSFLDKVIVIKDAELKKEREHVTRTQEALDLESRCFALRADGMTDEQIARQVSLTPNRVKSLIESARLKQELNI